MLKISFYLTIAMLIKDINGNRDIIKISKKLFTDYYFILRNNDNDILPIRKEHIKEYIKILKNFGYSIVFDYSEDINV